MARFAAGLLTLSLLAAGCGVLPGTGGDDGSDAPLAGTPLVFPTPLPTATPTPIPTPTSRPTATPLPTPTPTPAVGDSYTEVLDLVRNVFTASDKIAAIEQIVPVPLPITIPADARLDELELAYGQWDVWTAITGSFPPVDQPADVRIEVAYSTETSIDELREDYVGVLTDAGFVIATENSQEELFADVSLELNGGEFTRGIGGRARVNALRQGESNFVQFDLYIEIPSDPVPAIVNWPEIFAVPFPGGYTLYGALAAARPAGIEVSTTARWTTGSAATDIRGIMETLIEAYPTETVTVSGTIEQTAPTQPAVTTFSHPTGGGGSIAVFDSADGVLIEMLLVSLPG